MSDDKAAEVALEYLRLARGEILEKTKIVNQTLVAYLGGTAALVSWFFEKAYRPEASPEMSSKAIAFAVVISYLACAVDWVIYHNERIIAGLALYQRRSLSKAIGNNPRMWERSGALRRIDSRWKALTHVLVEQFIVLSPAFAVLTFVWRHIHFANLPNRLWFGFALVANVLSLGVALGMGRTTWQLRNTGVKDRFCLAAGRHREQYRRIQVKRNIID